jgi:hypothetical protein
MKERGGAGLMSATLGKTHYGHPRHNTLLSKPVCQSSAAYSAPPVRLRPSKRCHTTASNRTRHLPCGPKNQLPRARTPHKMRISTVRGQKAHLHGHLLLEEVQQDATVHAGVAVCWQHTVGAACVVSHALGRPVSRAIRSRRLKSG